MYQGMGKRRLGDGSQKASRLPRDFDELFPSFILNLLLLHGPAFGNRTQVCTISIRFVLFFSHSVMSDSLPPCGLHHCRIPCPSLSPGVCSNSCPLSQGCHPTISSSVVPFFSSPQSFPASGSFFSELSLYIRWPKFRASALALVLPVNTQGWFPLGLLIWSPCCSRDSHKSSAPQFESINSLDLSLLIGPNLTSIHDFWKNHSFDYTNLCQKGV